MYPVPMSELEVAEFLDHRPTGHQLAARARYTAISHLHDFYWWATRANLTDSDPTERTLRPRVSPGLPRPIDDEDLALAVATAAGRVRTMLLLAALAGLRCAEIHSLRWRDVNLTRAELRVMGKGRRERIVPIPVELVAHLAGLERQGMRVVSMTSPGRVSQTLNRHLRDLGITSTAHSLRHWYATAALRSSSNIAAVQSLLGHSSPTTTAIYARLDRSVLAPVVENIRLPESHLTG